jgi:hypothetical protein
MCTVLLPPGDNPTDISHHKENKKRNVIKVLGREWIQDCVNNTDNARIWLRRGVFVHHCCSGEQYVFHIVCECVTLVILRAMRMRHVIICGLSCSTIFFPHYLTNGTISERKLLNTKCVFSFSLQSLSETFLILRRTDWDVNINEYWSCCKASGLLLTRFNESWTFSTVFYKFPNVLYHENTSSGSRIVHCGEMDGWTDRHDEANDRLQPFCERT